MKTNGVLLLILAGMLMLTVSCKKTPEISGEGVVARDVFVNMLVDLHLVDGVTNDPSYVKRYPLTDSIDLLGPILDKYGVEKSVFDSTMTAYSRQPALFDELYNDVLMKLNMMQDENDYSTDP
ncbi:MAG: DUF4296 domain-containing protein [Bacteroidales bacterium]